MTTATYAPAPMALGTTPQLAPYGFWGDLAGAVAPTAGRIIGGVFGNEQLGGQIGSATGQLAQRFLPFQAGLDTTLLHPLVAQQLVQQQAAGVTPYGFFGDLAGMVAPTAGRILGGMLGSEQLGGQVGSMAGQLAQRFLPFQAGVDTTWLHPVVAQQLATAQLAAQQQAIAQQQAVHAAQAQQLAPYGFFGDLASAVAPTAGRILGGVFGNEQFGGQVGSVAGQLARFLPFQSGPTMPTGTIPTGAIPTATIPTAVQPQLAPYGLIGGALGGMLGGIGGNALGGLLGNSDLGRTIGSTAGGILGGILPFGATVPQATVPQSIVPQAIVPQFTIPQYGVPQYAGVMR